MRTAWTIALPLVLALGACETTTSGAGAAGTGYVNLPESITAIAAPSQDLSKVMLSPEDGCYYYLWDGPVEATFLPLRTTAGNPICTRAS